MSLWKKIVRRIVRRELERKISRELVERHWPAIEATLRAEFGGPCLDVALRAGRRACHRLIEHIL